MDEKGPGEATGAVAGSLYPDGLCDTNMRKTELRACCPRVGAVLDDRWA